MNDHEQAKYCLDTILKSIVKVPKKSKRLPQSSNKKSHRNEGVKSQKKYKKSNKQENITNNISSFKLDDLKTMKSFKRQKTTFQ